MFGCTDGFYVVNPADVKAMGYTGHPIFTGLVVDNQEVMPGQEYFGRVILEKALSHTKKIVLEHDQNYVTIQFSGLNFDMPAHTYYKFRLSGLDSHWTETSPADGRGVATYTDLPPGTYHFELYSAGFDKRWTRKPLTLEIVVKAPWWATWWARLIYLLAIITVAFLMFRWKMNQKRKELENEKYKELEEMKYRFFTNISHEFLTLLTLIITPIGTLLKRTHDPEEKAELNAVSKNAGDLLQLVNQLLDFRKMEMNGERLHLASGNLDEFVKYTAAKFKPLSEQKNIRLEVNDKTEGLFMYFDRDKVGKILTNLLSNAFKYTQSGGLVSVTLEKEIVESRRYARVSVKDTGCGISTEDQKRVFDRFYRSENQNGTKVGSGIGLNMVQEYVKLHEGKISLESEIGRGSTFVVELPTDLKASPSPSERKGCSATKLYAEKTSDKETQGSKHTIHPPYSGELGEASVLIVEDNPDFHDFLVRELGHVYNKVLSAEDGVQGALLAEEENPDIIVSDVMMPRMSGTDMCRRLKENIATSHIPVILLTAWSTDEARTEGYKAGADAYIAKPFDMEVLLSRISNLLEKQKLRRQEFSHNISLDPKTVTDSSADEKLLKQVIDLIEENIDDSEYSVDTLARDVLMSRMSLYRKMKALTGQTPADFIRTVRLKTAAALLKDGNVNVSEACYRTGFASPQNFSKHFKEMFGVLPSQYK